MIDLKFKYAHYTFIDKDKIEAWKSNPKFMPVDKYPPGINIKTGEIGYHEPTNMRVIIKMKGMK